MAGGGARLSATMHSFHFGRSRITLGLYVLGPNVYQYYLHSADLTLRGMIPRPLGKSAHLRNAQEMGALDGTPQDMRTNLDLKVKQREPAT